MENVGFRGLGKSKMSCYLMGEEFLFGKMKNVPETGYTVKTFFILLSCTLKNDSYGNLDLHM